MNWIEPDWCIVDVSRNQIELDRIDGEFKLGWIESVRADGPRGPSARTVLADGARGPSDGPNMPPLGIERKPNTI